MTRKLLINFLWTLIPTFAFGVFLYQNPPNVAVTDVDRAVLVGLTLNFTHKLYKCHKLYLSRRSMKRG